MIQWTRDGIRGHIFNPSGFTLGVFSVVLLTTGTASPTYGMEIASTLGRAPPMDFWIFLHGLIVPTNFPVVLVCARLFVSAPGRPPGYGPAARMAERVRGGPSAGALRQIRGGRALFPDCGASACEER